MIRITIIVSHTGPKEQGLYISKAKCIFFVVVESAQMIIARGPGVYFDTPRYVPRFPAL